MKTPCDKFKLIKTVKIPNQDVYTLYSPYSDVLRSLVNIGVVITLTAFCVNVQIKNQNDALT